MVEETATMIANLVNTVGFPVAMVILIFVTMSKMMEAWRSTIESLGNTVDANTNAITQLITYIKAMNKKDD